MLIIPVKEGENIDRALKRFKRKFLQTQVLKEIRQRKEFTKKSEKLSVHKKWKKHENAHRTCSDFDPELPTRAKMIS